LRLQLKDGASARCWPESGFHRNASERAALQTFGPPLAS
jgi:hypothetical protein